MSDKMLTTPNIYITNPNIYNIFKGSVSDIDAMY